MYSQQCNRIKELLGNYVVPSKEEIFQSRHDVSDPRIGDYLFTYADMLQTKTKEFNAVLLSIPQDMGVSRNGGRIGAALAPDMIKKSLFKLTPYSCSNNVLDSIGLFDGGCLQTENLTLEEAQAIQENCVKSLLEEGFFPVVIGGGHETGYPDGAALGTVFNNIGILNFDAHTDVRPLIDNRLGHSGSPFRQIIERKDVNLDGTAFVEFGIQPFAAAETHCDYVKRIGGTILTYNEIRKTGFEASLENALFKCTQSTDAVFVSFDIDAISSAYAPGVSAPATIGFTADEFLYTAERVGEHEKVRLVDFVEMNPLFDIDNRTAKLVALGIGAYLVGLSKRL